MSKRTFCARMVWSRFLVGLMGCALIAGPIILVKAAPSHEQQTPSHEQQTQSRRQQSAQQLVEEALHREI